MICIQQAHCYTPQDQGIQDVLIAGGQIVAMGRHLHYPDAKQIDGRGMILTPGLIDQHVHITGGGGEGGFQTRAPEIQLSALIRAGITTVGGLLGTDGTTRSVENLIAKAKALKAEGVSVVAMTGSYGYPSVTLTGDVKKDIVFIEEVIGVKLALSDHRCSHPTLQEFIRLASDVRVAGMISGKAGILVLHMGDEPQGLDLIFEALDQTALPVQLFHPTHVSRNPQLFEQALQLLKRGGWIDLTCGDQPQESCGANLDQARRRQLDLSRITISSDGQGSWSDYDEQGNLRRIGISSVGALMKEWIRLVQDYHFSIPEALSFVTVNPARALQLKRKGTIALGMDADVLLLDEKTWQLQTVIAAGRIMMENGRLQVRGTFEEAF